MKVMLLKNFVIFSMKKVKNILIYYSSSQMSIDLASLMLELQKRNYNIIFLTHCKRGVLHSFLEERGILVESVEIEGSLGRIVHLIKYCLLNKIDVVNSHIQVNNFILSVAQPFINAKCIMTRHHSDYVYNGTNQKAKLFDKFINLFSQRMIAISDKVASQLIGVEEVSSHKVFRVNNGYDFTLYNNYDPNFNLEINAGFTIIAIGRFIPLKRHLLLLKAFNNIIKKGYNFKLILVGDGILKENIVSFLEKEKLKEKVILTGHVSNVMDYLAISDLLVHVSESEASSTVVKEAGILNVASLVCENVGDFDEYLNNKNSYKIQKNIEPLDLTNKLIQIYNDKEGLKEKGIRINVDIKKRFSIENTIKYFLNIINN